MTQDIMKIADELTSAARNWPTQNPMVEANARAALQSAVEALQAERDALAARLQALQEQEPVGFFDTPTGSKTASIILKDPSKPMRFGQELYTAPKATTPLTDEQIDKGQWDDGTESTADFKAGVRFAEKHHMIGGQLAAAVLAARNAALKEVTQIDLYALIRDEGRVAKADAECCAQKILTAIEALKEPTT